MTAPANADLDRPGLVAGRGELLIRSKDTTSSSQQDDAAVVEVEAAKAIETSGSAFDPAR